MPLPYSVCVYVVAERRQWLEACLPSSAITSTRLVHTIRVWTSGVERILRSHSE